MLIKDFTLRFEGSDTTKRIELYLRHKNNFYHNHMIGNYNNKTKVLRINYNKSEHAFFSELLVEFKRSIDMHRMNTTEVKLCEEILTLYTKQRVAELVLMKMHETVNDNNRKLGNNVYYTLVKQFLMEISQNRRSEQDICALALQLGYQIKQSQLTSDCDYFRDFRDDEALRNDTYIFEHLLIPALATQLTDLNAKVSIWLEANMQFLRMHNIDVKFKTCSKCGGAQSTHLMSCSHTFCVDCIYDAMHTAEYLKVPYQCPVCKEDQMFVPDANVININYVMTRNMSLIKRSNSMTELPSSSVTSPPVFEPVCELTTPSTSSAVVAAPPTPPSVSVVAHASNSKPSNKPVFIAKSKNHPSKKFKKSKDSDSSKSSDVTKSKSKTPEPKTPTKASASSKSKQSKLSFKPSDKSTSNKSETVVSSATANDQSSNLRKRRVLSSSDEEEVVPPVKTIKVEPVWDSERIAKFKDVPIDSTCVINIGDSDDDENSDHSDSDDEYDPYHGDLNVAVCRAEVDIVQTVDLFPGNIFEAETQPPTPDSVYNADTRPNTPLPTTADTQPPAPLTVDAPPADAIPAPVIDSNVQFNDEPNVSLPCNPEFFENLAIKQEMVHNTEIVNNYYLAKANRDANDENVNVDEKGITKAIVTPVAEDDDDVVFVSCKRGNKDIDVKDVLIPKGFLYVANVEQQCIEKVGIKTEFTDPNIIKMATFIQTNSLPLYGSRVCKLRNSIKLEQLLPPKEDENPAPVADTPPVDAPPADTPPADAPPADAPPADPSIDAEFIDNLLNDLSPPPPASAPAAMSPISTTGASAMSPISTTVITSPTGGDVNKPFIRLGPQDSCHVFDNQM
ncbi:hoar [Leucania separata nucleopolyhedrovirus]|uniref:Hoar n=1 Tax=Leucania separata nucleopolyhedrovirus TaxID=1307956 RepID=Q0ILB3_NPVLS|nr:hoar [Leucania separata nucleopolyhedrovirus]AAR28770.1 hoar [Leucania separata nucleopolyhedrovirus]